MNNIENLYKEYAVKITTADNFGSGCIFQPLNENYTYIFTAKHCLEENGILAKSENIKVYRYLDSGNENHINIKSIYLHDLLDLAVIVVEKLSNPQNLLASLAIKDSDVTIYGYPYKLKDSPEQRENISCKVSFRHDNYFELSSDKIQFTYETSVPENIIGLSGSGVFSENKNQLRFCGLFIELKGVDGAYNKFCALNSISINEFLISKQLPALYSNSFDAIKTENSLLEKVFYLPYEINCEPYYLERSIDQTIFNYFSSSKHLWISGNSGVGKTNLSFRNLLFNNKKFVFIDLSTLNKKDINEHFQYINNEIIEQCALLNPIVSGNIFDVIAKNIEQIPTTTTTIIFVDEVPILDKDKFYEFVVGFISISDKCFNRSTNKKLIKWIISTRINPVEHIQNSEDCLPNKKKAHKNFNFKNLELWNEEDLLDLLFILQSSLNFSLTSDSIQDLINVSSGLPGKLKDVIERVIIERCSIDKAIEMIRNESV